jgi:hypothetical protein
MHSSKLCNHTETLPTNYNVIVYCIKCPYISVARLAIATGRHAMQIFNDLHYSNPLEMYYF